MDTEKKEFGAWWMWVLGLLVVSIVVFGALNAAGIFTRTVVERKVFENSFQYSEARKAEIATYEAQLAELARQLTDPALSDKHSQIQAQMAAIRIQLSTAQRR